MVGFCRLRWVYILESQLFDFSPKQSNVFSCWLNGVTEDFPDKLSLPANFTLSCPSPHNLSFFLSRSVTLFRTGVLTYEWSLPAARRRPGVQPPKIAEPTQSGRLQRSEGQFWRRRYLLCTFRHFNALSAVCGGREHHSGRTKKQCTRPQQNICPRHPNNCWSHLSTSHSGRHTEAQWSPSLSCYKHPQRFISLLEGCIYLFISLLFS